MISRRWAKGSSPQWRRVRATVLEAAGNRCQLRLPGCTTVATQVHHTRPREIVGDAVEHLRAACAPCNLKVGDPTKGDPEPRHGGW